MKLLDLCRLGALLVASCFLSGCAPAYHAYPNGCVTYGYRPQPAPPFAFYRGCPTPLLARREANAGHVNFNASGRQKSPGDDDSESPRRMQP